MPGRLRFIDVAFGVLPVAAMGIDDHRVLHRQVERNHLILRILVVEGAVRIGVTVGHGIVGGGKEHFTTHAGLKPSAKMPRTSGAP